MRKKRYGRRGNILIYFCLNLFNSKAPVKSKTQTKHICILKPVGSSSRNISSDYLVEGFVGEWMCHTQKASTVEIAMHTRSIHCHMLRGMFRKNIRQERWLPFMEELRKTYIFPFNRTEAYIWCTARAFLVRKSTQTWLMVIKKFNQPCQAN